MEMCNSRKAIDLFVHEHVSVKSHLHTPRCCVLPRFSGFPCLRVLGTRRMTPALLHLGTSQGGKESTSPALHHSTCQQHI